MSERGYFRKRIKEKDEFESATQRAVVYLRDNPREVALTVGGVVLALLLVGGVWFYMGWRQERLVRVGGEAVRVYEEARGDRAKLGPAATTLEGIYGDHSGDAVGQQALFLAAALRFDEGDAAKALEHYRTLVDKHGDNTLLKPLALKGQAAAQEEAGDLAAARATLEGLLAPEAGVPKAAVLADLARLDERLGQPDRADDARREIVESFPDSPWADDARERLGLPPKQAD